MSKTKRSPSEARDEIGRLIEELARRHKKGRIKALATIAAGADGLLTPRAAGFASEDEMWHGVRYLTQGLVADDTPDGEPRDDRADEADCIATAQRLAARCESGSVAFLAAVTIAPDGV